MDGGVAESARTCTGEPQDAAVAAPAPGGGRRPSRGGEFRNSLADTGTVAVADTDADTDTGTGADTGADTRTRADTRAGTPPT
jgi:hypothetical protein